MSKKAIRLVGSSQQWPQGSRPNTIEWAREGENMVVTCERSSVGGKIDGLAIPWRCNLRRYGVEVQMTDYEKWRIACPHCGTDLRDGHGTRLIHIVDRDKDCVTKYECPDCEKQWDRSLAEAIPK